MPIELGGAEGPRSDRKRIVRLAGVAAAAIVAIVVVARAVSWAAFRDPVRDPAFWADKCVQPEILAPDGAFVSATQFFAEDYRNVSAQLLGGAVRVPTESFDDMAADPRRDKRFDVFAQLHAHLNASFPRAARHVELVNSYGLLYTVRGASRRHPSVFMAHQDVVPVEPETVDQWTHEPFSGFFDGERVWGRGSADTKSSLVAILEAVESLLGQGWVPSHDVVLAFGFDEELDGSRGAGPLADTIRERYDNSVALIVDEGSAVSETAGSVFAMPGVGEKGYTDVEIVVRTPGGHSSKPPDHTGIGIASDAVVQLERYAAAHHDGELQASDATAELFTCFAAHGEDLSLAERKTFVDARALREFLLADPQLRPLITTTHAVDIISGGAKVNALPEQVSFTVNHRIAVHESVASVTDAVERVLEGVAARHGLGLLRNDRTVVDPTAKGHIEIRNGQSLEPSPVAPHTPDSPAWRLLAGTSRHILEEYFRIENVYVAPLILGGNTDTVHYWGLTDNIYRYTLGLPDSGANAHTVDEWTSIDSHLATVAWYYELLQFV